MTLCLITGGQAVGPPAPRSTTGSGESKGENHVQDVHAPSRGARVRAFTRYAVRRRSGSAEPHVQLRLRPAEHDRLRHRRQHLRRQAEGAERRQDEHQPVPRRAARPGTADAAEDARGRHRLRHHVDGERIDAGAAGRRALAALHLPRSGAPGQGARRPGDHRRRSATWSRTRCRARRCSAC